MGKENIFIDDVPGPFVVIDVFIKRRVVPGMSEINLIVKKVTKRLAL